jgi:hypothetical protein
VLVLLAAAACSTPEENGGSSDGGSAATSASTAPRDPNGPREDATLTGRVVGLTGAPLSGLPVTVVEHRPQAGLDAALTAFFTLGIACVATGDACDTSAKVVDSATTGADGRFELTLPDAYLPGYETDEDWVVQVGRAPADGEMTGPSSSFELEVNTRVQESPDLVLWDASPTVTTRGDLWQVQVPALTGGAPLRDLATRLVDDRGNVLWTVHGTSVDPRVIEDRTVRVVTSGTADVTVRHADGRTIYHQSVAAPTMAVTGGGTPPSRGAGCTQTGGGLVGCLYTDGDLAAQVDLPPKEAVTVDLGAPTEVGLVVVRGVIGSMDPDAEVQVSTDGTTWTDLEERPLDGADGWSAAAGGGPVRYVCVTGPRSLAEITAWPPTAAERAAASADAPDSDAGAGGGVKAVAIGALVVVAGAAVVVRRRRGAT